MNVLPFTTALFSDKGPAVLNQLRVQKLHLTKAVVLQSRQNVYQDETNQEAHFLYPLIRMKRGTLGHEKLTVGTDLWAVISCYLHERKGLFGVGAGAFLDFATQRLFIHRLCANVSYCAICATHSPVQITVLWDLSMQWCILLVFWLHATIQLMLWSLGKKYTV